MLHPHVFLVKNFLMLYQSTVTLCLISNQVSRSSLVLVSPIIGQSEVFFRSFLIGSPIFSTIIGHKNMFENIFNTVMDVKGKTKDNIKARLDVALFCNRKNMDLVCDESWVAKPRASFMLEKNTQLLVYK